jgi:PRC-barrel domain
MADSWVGFEVDDRDGDRVAGAYGLYVDAESGEPSWLIAAVGRRRRKLVAIPFEDCAGGVGRVWVAHGRETIREAPGVDPTRPLLREHELAICEHFGIGERVGRAAEIAGRAAGEITSRPGP